MMDVKTLQTVGSIVVILMIAKVLNLKGLLLPHIDYIKGKVKNSKLALIVTSCLMGCLPIPGRITMTAPIVEQLGKKMKIDKNDLAFIDFWSTHHYYLHSPLEKSIISTLALTGLTYSSFVGGLLPVLACVLITGILLISRFDSMWLDANTATDSSLRGLLFVPFVFVAGIASIIAFNGHMVYILMGMLSILCIYSKCWTWDLFKIDWWLPSIIFTIIVITSYIKQYVVIPYNENAIFYMLPVGFLIGLVFGSSSRMATIGMPIVIAISTPSTLLANVVLFYSVEYAGYLLSPAHKCVAIAARYFKADLTVYYLRISLVSLSAVVGGFISYCLML